MLSLSVFFTALAVLAPIVIASPVATAPSTVSTSTAKLNTLAKSRGKVYFGSATDNPELTNTSYVAILDDNTMFGQLTAANSMKWASYYSWIGVGIFGLTIVGHV